MPKSQNLLTMTTLALTLVLCSGLGFDARAITEDTGGKESVSGTDSSGKDPGKDKGKDNGETAPQGGKDKPKDMDKPKDKGKEPGKDGTGAKDDAKAGSPQQCAAGADLPGC